MYMWHAAQNGSHQGVTTLYQEQDLAMILYDDLAYNLHCKFGLSEQKASHLAGDIYKVIEN